MATTTTTNRLVALTLVALGVLLVLSSLFAGGGMMGYRGPMMGWMYGTNAPGWLFAVGLVGQLLLVALVVGVGYLAYRTLTGERTDPAMDELRAAFARGDIDDEEFDRREARLRRDER